MFVMLAKMVALGDTLPPHLLPHWPRPLQSQSILLDDSVEDDTPIFSRNTIDFRFVVSHHHHRHHHHHYESPIMSSLLPWPFSDYLSLSPCATIILLTSYNPYRYFTRYQLVCLFYLNNNNQVVLAKLLSNNNLTIINRLCSWTVETVIS